MSMSDPLADMLTRIRNATKSRFNSVEIPLSTLKVSVARVLKNEGYISDYQIIKDGPQGILKLHLKYGAHNEIVISGIRRVSKPGHRRYTTSDNIPKVMSGLGIAILTTSKGVITDKEARTQNIGGELLCEVW
ncbi:SSU ribosomal protein S8P [Desulfobulbus propionicus DSM 2032]|jgi:small subunit ribosomal protein S8|uniref:Small ribosomal subunit protein uS8 n=1 Tax=Desulfobulbus propionicus (strain ATCC 33891 / DSM 2032 / VKM B-1956 / 1pr3) TaxID=577650 RepID=A0A7U4DNE5_DESPD|nr:30S ribosomal protein S8 [Desulfobulbus propionicus]ADW16976.1 SSU ribosomal protein S8P [Desulfobulbus propionicus DSM 2032]